LCKDDDRLAAEVLRLLAHADVEPEFLQPFYEVECRAPSAHLGRVVGRRWRLKRVIGVGSSACVYEVQDVETDRVAALKLVAGFSDGRIDAVRQEISFLRWLRLPGVVKLLDDGVEGDSVFVVTELVEGTAFPGTRGPRRWSTVSGATTSLLETVAAMHAAGVVHCDLKPDNVLVKADGGVVVLDLGLSAEGRRRLSSRESLYVGGTPAYAPPEQFGGDPDPRWDVFAIGAMVSEALALGSFARPGGPTPDDVPAEVYRTLASWTAHDPGRRPKDARRALEMLCPPKRVARRRGRTTENGLRDRFAGPDLLLHLREDAAHELFLRTRGRPNAVERELASWVRSGLAREDGGLICVPRTSIERLRMLRAASSRIAVTSADLLDREFAEAMRTARPRRVALFARRVAIARIAEGRPSAATAALFEGAAAAGAADDRRLEIECLVDLAAAAVRTGIAGELDFALMRVQRASIRSRAVADLETTIRAAVHYLSARPADALRAVTSVCRTDAHEGVTTIAWLVRGAAARTMGARAETASLRGLQRWLRNHRVPEGDRMLHTATGWNAYRRGAWRVAVAAHENAAGAATDAQSRVRCLLDAAFAAVEYDAARARSLASRARDDAAALRNPLPEARAMHVVRMAVLRSGATVAADLELVDAVARIGLPSLSAVVPMTEAAISWRSRDYATARNLAETAAANWGASPPADFCRAIAAAAGAPMSDAEIRRCRTTAIRLLPSAVGMQALALLAIARPDWKRRLNRDFNSMRLARSDCDSERIREVLSIREARSLVSP
jgi:serine/threonine-protein kinase